MAAPAGKSVARNLLAGHQALATLLRADPLVHGFRPQSRLLRATWKPSIRCFSNVAIWPDVNIFPPRIASDDLLLFKARGFVGYSAPVGMIRFKSTVAVPVGQQEATSEEEGAQGDASIKSPGEKVRDELQKAKESGLLVSEYWGVAPKKFTREDGTLWPWNSFRPTEAYTADLSIDLKRHHKTDTLIDKIAFHTVKMLRLPTDIFFQVRRPYWIVGVRKLSNCKLLPIRLNLPFNRRFHNLVCSNRSKTFALEECPVDLG